jgi:tetratricopeptide (TPR) repeat protein
MTYFQQALQLRQKLNDPGQTADTLYNLGETYARMGQYGQGVDYYLRGLELWRKVGDKRGIAIASYGLGIIFGYEGRYGAALSSQEDALKSFRDLNDRSFWLAQIQSAYGNTLTLIGRGDEAQKSLDEALGLARELKNESLAAQILNFQGDRGFYRGEFKAARPLYNQALQAATRASDRQQTLLSKFGLAKLAVKEGRWREATGSLKSLSQDADRAGLKYLSVECTLYLGEAHTAGRDFAAARQELDDGMRTSERLGLQGLLAEGHYLLGSAIRLSGNQAEAARHYAEALRILDEIGKEARTNTLLKRSDFATLYQESSRWSQSPKN